MQTVTQDTVSRFCGIILLKEKKKKPHALLLPHQGRRKKIPGGMQEAGDASPYDAMIREALEELEVQPLNAEPQGDYPDPNNPLNLRAFWVASEWAGSIRTEKKLIEGEWIEPPEWVEITPELVNEYRPQIVYSHMVPLKKGILWGMMRFPAFGYFAHENQLVA